MTVHFLAPRQIGDMPVDFHQAEPEVGGIVVVIWRSEARHDGFMVHCRDWGAVHRLLRTIETEIKNGMLF